MGTPASASPLVRLLSEWHCADAEASPGMDFAQRLSQWVNAFDAMGLQSAHEVIRRVQALAQRSGGARGPAPAALAQDVDRVRGVLAHAIAQPVPEDLARPGDRGGGAFAPWRDRHLELQRQMALMIEPLRAHVRESASRRSTRLRQLAVLDAAMEQMLARREHTLLPATTSLLKRRFEQLRDAASDASGDEADDAWLQAFGREWRQVLLAELEVRLAPVAGLVEAAANEWDER